MMRIYNTVVFKSEKKMYDLEKSGKKTNTVRVLDRDEMEKLRLSESTPTRIVIKNAVTERGFERDITDISVIGELCGKTIVVFSWKHEE